jgi:hypothetical protein
MRLTAILGACFLVVMPVPVTGNGIPGTANPALGARILAGLEVRKTDTGQSSPQVQPGQPAPTTQANGQAPNPASTGKATSKNPKHHKSATPPASAPGAGKSAGSKSEATPPPKVVVKDGGSDATAVQLKGTSDEEQQRADTTQLTSATEDNLKKIAERPLASSEQQTVSQVKQFIQQSKVAVATGDLQRGHELATKAKLLSEELVKQ